MRWIDCVLNGKVFGTFPTGDPGSCVGAVLAMNKKHIDFNSIYGIIMTSKEIKELEKKIDKLQETVERLENKLNKHIDFIDDTYEGLRNPINAAKKWLGR